MLLHIGYNNKKNQYSLHALLIKTTQNTKLVQTKNNSNCHLNFCTIHGSLASKMLKETSFKMNKIEKKRKTYTPKREDLEENPKRIFNT